MIFIAASLFLAACSCEPDFIDCSVRCGAKNICQEGTSCDQGFCRKPGAPGPCTCRPGETSPCGSAVGECQQGTQTCQSDKTWGACIGEGLPSPEVCDTKDNDCNGMVDDDPVDAILCPKQEGVCAGKRRACVNGQYPLTCGAPDYGPTFETVETRCDGLDNDCDGRVDSLKAVKLSDAGIFVMVGFDGGYGLVTARPTAGGFALDGTVYNERLVPQGPAVQIAVGTGSLRGLSGIGRGDRAVVYWTEQAAPPSGPYNPAGFEWLYVAPGSPTPLSGLPAAGERGTGVFSIAMPPAGILGAHLLNDGGAQLLTWATSPALPPAAAPFGVPGLTLSQVDSIGVSSQGRAAKWTGSAMNGAGSQIDGGVVALVGGRQSLAQPQGALFDIGNTLQSAWMESILQASPPKNESSVVMQYDVWDGGSFQLRTFPNNIAIGSFAATQTPGNVFLAWTEYGQLRVGTPSSGTNVTVNAPYDGGSVFQLQTVNGGGEWNVVSWQVAGVYAQLVCSP
jgi:hypothetical protein